MRVREDKTDTTQGIITKVNRGTITIRENEYCATAHRFSRKNPAIKPHEHRETTLAANQFAIEPRRYFDVPIFFTSATNDSRSAIHDFGGYHPAQHKTPPPRSCNVFLALKQPPFSQLNLEKTTKDIRLFVGIF